MDENASEIYELDIQRKAEDTLQLEKFICELELLFELPRLFLCNFITDIKTAIDLASIKNELTDKRLYIKMINCVDQFENDCLKKFHGFDPFLVQETLATINNAKSCIQSIKTNIDLEEIMISVYDCFYKLEKIIFKNQTIVYLENSLQNDIYRNKTHDPNSIGILLIIENQYFGKLGLHNITK